MCYLPPINNIKTKDQIYLIRTTVAESEELVPQEIFKLHVINCSYKSYKPSLYEYQMQLPVLVIYAVLCLCVPKWTAVSHYVIMTFTT